jgi:MarR family transcriptional regulator for hemolysin
MATAIKPTVEAAESVDDVAVDCPECLAESLGWLLAQADYGLASAINASLSPLGVSHRTIHVLATALDGEYTQKELADLIGLDKTTMVVTIDELEAAGLAERLPSETDRRARVISVTKKGEGKVREGKTVIDRVQNDLLGSLPARERKIFLESLGTLVKERFAGQIHCSPTRRREPRA